MIGLGLALGLGALFGLGGALIQSNTSRSIANENIAFQQEENETTREREDNAVQRRAEDLRRAGLSATLAAGSAASSQALTAPHNDYQAPNYGESILNGAQALANLQLTDAQAQNAQAQAQHQQLVNANYEDNLHSEMDLRNSQAELNRSNNKIAQIEGKYRAQEIETNLEKTTSEIMKNYSGVQLNDAQKQQIAQEITESVARTEKLSQETKTEVFNTAYRMVEWQTATHNLGYYQNIGRPTNAVGGLTNLTNGLGSDLISFKNGLVEGIPKAWDSYKKWYNSGGFFRALYH